jgi:hypothetical protein
MSSSDSTSSRRRFLQHAVLAAAAAPVAARLGIDAARAADLPHLEETDPTAGALGYKHDTTAVDAAKFPAHRPEQTCANCNLVQAQEGDWRPCAIFPGKAVNAKGWCAAWAKKA